MDTYSLFNFRIVTDAYSLKFQNSKFISAITALLEDSLIYVVCAVFRRDCGMQNYKIWQEGTCISGRQFRFLFPDLKIFIEIFHISNRTPVSIFYKFIYFCPLFSSSFKQLELEVEKFW